MKKIVALITLIANVAALSVSVLAAEDEYISKGEFYNMLYGTNTINVGIDNEDNITTAEAVEAIFKATGLENHEAMERLQDEGEVNVRMMISVTVGLFDGMGVSTTEALTYDDANKMLDNLSDLYVNVYANPTTQEKLGVELNLAE